MPLFAASLALTKEKARGGAIGGGSRWSGEETRRLSARERARRVAGGGSKGSGRLVNVGVSVFQGKLFIDKFFVELVEGD